VVRVVLDFRLSPVGSTSPDHSAGDLVAVGGFEHVYGTTPIVHKLEQHVFVVTSVRYNTETSRFAPPSDKVGKLGGVGPTRDSGFNLGELGQVSLTFSQRRNNLLAKSLIGACSSRGPWVPEEKDNFQLVGPSLYILKRRVDTLQSDGDALDVATVQHQSSLLEARYFSCIGG
jgi:hypothetical protein